LPHTARHLHGHVGGLRQSGKRARPQAQILFDRFHIVKHLNDAVEEVRRSEMRRLSQKEKVPFKRSRWLLLKNPWNLSDDRKERLSTLGWSLSRNSYACCVGISMGF
jgi:transposase